MLKRAITAIAVLPVVALAGCGSEKPQWALKDISGLMPPLQFTLTGESARTVRADDFQGKVTLLFFGYTNCPDVCPTTLTTLSRSLDELGPEAKEVRVLFVTVDPERDTVEALRKYTDFFGSEFVGLRGDEKQLQALAKRYRVAYSRGEPDANGDYPVTHSSAVFIFDREGQARLLAKASDGAEEIAEDLKRLL